jgi:hypothetical protein
MSWPMWMLTMMLLLVIILNTGLEIQEAMH